MPSITRVRPIKTNTDADLLNAIRNTASQNYREYVPYATKDNFQTVGNIIMDFVPVQNEFVNALINRFMAVWVESADYENPWAFFSKGDMQLGETIEQVWVDLIKPHQYDPALAETEIFKREYPNVYSAFHYVNSKLFYKLTIEHETLRAAFNTWGGLKDFTANLVKSMSTSEADDEFAIMRALMARHILDGHFYPVSVPTITEDNMRSITSAIKGVSNDLVFLSRKYNPAGVKTKSKKDDQYLISTGSFDASMDVNVLATSFNMDKAEFMGHRVLAPTFSEQENDRLVQLIPDFEPFTDEELAALAEVPGVLVDRSWFVFVTNLRQMRDMPNGQGLSWQYWYHCWKTYSVNPYASAVVFVPGTPKINSVSVSPSEVSAYPGTTVQASATVDTDFFASKAVTWTSNSTDITVDRRGIITISPEAEAGDTATITATSVFDPTKTDTCVVTVAGGSVEPVVPVVVASPTSVDCDIAAGDSIGYTDTVTLSGADHYEVKSKLIQLPEVIGDTPPVAGVTVEIQGSTLTATAYREDTSYTGDISGTIVVTGIGEDGGVADVTITVGGTFS